MVDRYPVITLCGSTRFKDASDIYEKLTDTETGLYRESPGYVYGLLQDELNFGHIVQAEL